MVELLVVMTIIAILVGISLVSFDGIRKSARDGKRKADLESIRSALEVYRTDCREYPPEVDFGSELAGPDDHPFCGGVSYMETVPNDGNPAYSYYYYYNSLIPNKYTLCAHLEGSTEDTISECENNCTSGNSEDSPIACNYAVYSP